MSIKENKATLVHYQQCPAFEDPELICQCELYDDQAVEQATRAAQPSPADLIRRARKSGLIKAGTPYP